MANNGQVQTLGDSWCKTDLSTRKKCEGTFTWTVSGLSQHREEYGESLSEVSREFSLRSPDGKETKWILELFPKSGTTNYIKVVIWSRNKFDVKTKIQMTVINSSGAKVLVNNHFFNAPHVCTFLRNSRLDIWQSDWNSLYTGQNHYGHGRYDVGAVCLQNGDLTFNFELTLYGKPKSMYGSKKFNNIPEAENSKNDFPVYENLNEFYLSKEMSDVTIECQDKTFEGHQVILSASSPVFRGMFNANMKEKKSQHVEIKDLGPEVVSEMLRFVYTRSCVATEENPDLDTVSALLEAADKYQIGTLKDVCQSLLSSHLKVDDSLKVT